jgi:hypothetical protein
LDEKKHTRRVFEITSEGSGKISPLDVLGKAYNLGVTGPGQELSSVAMLLQRKVKIVVINT